MKKIFIFVLLLLLVPAICLAEPQVTSDKQTFNPFTGVYDLQGNVHVEIGDRIITGDAAKKAPSGVIPEGALFHNVIIS